MYEERERLRMFQLTAARRRLDQFGFIHGHAIVFQLTAARRRLAICLVLEAPFKCFNSQPPEGGWFTVMPS